MSKSHKNQSREEYLLYLGAGIGAAAVMEKCDVSMPTDEIAEGVEAALAQLRQTPMIKENNEQNEMNEWVAAEWWLVDDSGPVREIRAFIEAPGDPDGLFHLMVMNGDHYFETLEEAKQWIKENNDK